MCMLISAAGSFSLTVEVADWDLRAELAGIPRALPNAAAAAAAELTSQSMPTAPTPAAAGEVGPGGSGSRSGSPGTAPTAESPEASLPASLTRSDSSLPASGAAAAAQLAAGTAAAAASAVGSSVQQPPPVAVLDLVVKAFDTQRYDVTVAQCHNRVHWASALAQWKVERATEACCCPACSHIHVDCYCSQLLCHLQIMLDTRTSAETAAWECSPAKRDRRRTCVLRACLRRALDVFFVLLLGPYCLVSSTSHSTQHHHWGWHLKLPLAQPDEMLTLVSMQATA